MLLINMIKLWWEEETLLFNQFCNLAKSSTDIFMASYVAMKSYGQPFPIFTLGGNYCEIFTSKFSLGPN